MLWWFDTSGNSFRIANWNFLPSRASEPQHGSVWWWRHIVWNVVRWPGQNIQYPCQCQHPLNKNRQQETGGQPAASTNITSHKLCRSSINQLQESRGNFTESSVCNDERPLDCHSCLLSTGSLSSVWAGTEIKGNRKNCSSYIHQSFLISTSIYSDIYNIYRMSLFKVPGCGCSWFNEVS